MMSPRGPRVVWWGRPIIELVFFAEIICTMADSSMQLQLHEDTASQKLPQIP
jgi:hypothetical protein